MLYSAELGPLGLETDFPLSREDVFDKCNTLDGELQMDAALPFIPEAYNHRVISIYKGRR